jgi:hypothetical protein
MKYALCDIQTQPLPQYSIYNNGPVAYVRTDNEDLVRLFAAAPDLLAALKEIMEMNAEDRTPDRLDHAILLAQQATKDV